jgi:phosphoribosyl-ATP pyrophosphohydrolase/phosphoribosyl-AMP cyclohydrolase
VTQDARTGVVLMVRARRPRALERTHRLGEMHYHSRTRGAWHKGATSGNTQRVVSLSADCDRDAVLARVLPNGLVVSTRNSISCFVG